MADSSSFQPYGQISSFRPNLTPRQLSNSLQMDAPCIYCELLHGYQDPCLGHYYGVPGGNMDGAFQYCILPDECPEFCQDGSKIVAGGFGGCSIWDAATGSMMRIDLPTVGSVNFASDGKLVLIGVLDGSLRIWSVERCSLLPVIYVGHENRNIQIVFTFIKGDERYIVSGSEDNCLYIWEVKTGKIFQKIYQAHSAPVQCVTCHPTKSMIASASVHDIETVKLWIPL